MPIGTAGEVALAEGIELDESHPNTDYRLAYLDDLVRYAYALLGSLEEAEDVAIEVLQAAGQRGDLNRLRDPKLYLLGMARRKVADHFRKTRRERGAGTIALADVGDVASAPSKADEGAAVREVLSQLPEQYAEALILKYIHGLSAEEVAQVLGKTHMGTRSLLQRAREAFTKLGRHLAMEDQA